MSQNSDFSKVNFIPWVEFRSNIRPKNISTPKKIYTFTASANDGSLLLLEPYLTLGSIWLYELFVVVSFKMSLEVFKEPKRQVLQTSRCGSRLEF